MNPADNKCEMEIASHRITLSIEPLVRGICFHKGDLEIKDEVKGSLLSIEINPHMADYPILCGREGRQINALNYIVKRMGDLQNLETRLSLIKSFRGEPEQKREFALNQKFDEGELINTLEGMCNMAFDIPPVVNVSNVNGRLRVFISIEEPSHVDLSCVDAFGNIFYPYGFRNGRIIEIKLGGNKRPVEVR